MFISAMSTAAASMVAQNLGAGLYDRGKQVMYTAMRMALAMAAVIIVVVELAAPVLVGAFTDDPQAIHYAVLNLRIEILGQVFYAIFLVYHALMLGAGDTWWVFLSSFANCIVFRVVLSILFERFWGVEGIYVACAIAPCISVPVGCITPGPNRWRKHWRNLSKRRTERYGDLLSCKRRRKRRRERLGQLDPHYRAVLHSHAGDLDHRADLAGQQAAGRRKAGEKLAGRCKAPSL